MAETLIKVVAGFTVVFFTVGIVAVLWQAAYIRGKHGGMKLVSMGDGLENVSSKI